MSRTEADHIDERFVGLFRDGSATALPWTEIATTLNLSLEDVQMSVARLSMAGYVFDVRPDRGVALQQRPPFLVHTEVVPHLNTRWLGRSIRFYRTVDSTNDLLLAAGPQEEEGLVLFAEEQRKGRGRQGRKWEAPAGTALQFSILIRPTRGAWEASDATLAAAAGMVEGLQEATGVTARIRWPNDLSVDGQKVCGILSEYRTATGNFVIGIGLNVNQESGEIPEGGTSLRALTGRKTQRGPLLATLLRALERRIDQLREDGFEPVRQFVEEHSSLIGKRVELQIGREQIGGLATAIGPSGGLVLRSGTVEKEYCLGEVTRVLSWERAE